MGDNHYNCPVVAYYPEVLRGQHAASCADATFIHDPYVEHPPPA